MAYKTTRNFVKGFMKSLLLITFSFLLLLLLLTQQVFAESPYTLPYPSAMPGSLLYKIHRVIEPFKKLWYFGTFGQFTYNLQQSDRYLVEAKTLFEYKQYLLGIDSLKKSNAFFSLVYKNITKARQERKEATKLQSVYKEAAKKHIETLQFMKQYAPEEVLWAPENSISQNLALYSAIDKAIAVRESCL